MRYSSVSRPPPPFVLRFAVDRQSRKVVRRLTHGLMIPLYSYRSCLNSKYDLSHVSRNGAPGSEITTAFFAQSALGFEGDS